MSHKSKDYIMSHKSKDYKISHKSKDYKISAVNYYNKNDVSMDEDYKIKYFEVFFNFNIIKLYRFCFYILIFLNYQVQ